MIISLEKICMCSKRTCFSTGPASEFQPGDLQRHSHQPTRRGRGGQMVGPRVDWQTRSSRHQESLPKSTQPGPSVAGSTRWWQRWQGQCRWVTVYTGRWGWGAGGPRRWAGHWAEAPRWCGPQHAWLRTQLWWPLIDELHLRTATGM